jgi:hypothetical protein
MIIENKITRNFIQAEIAHCKQHHIKINLIKVESIDVSGTACGGFFNEEPNPKIVVATNKPLEQWLPIFVHESCHKDQFIEKDPVWSAKIKKHFDANSIFDQWINHACELNPRQLSQIIRQIIALELDCEQRAVQKIQQYNLPIDINEYTQKANAYIWQHRVIQKTRSWGEDTVYESKELWQQMPVDFCDSYAKISNKMLKLYMKHCY